ncbi:unnamed protein product (macronuclear) [Paramecium tetraurelia]|uniref:Protein kinase domain-containing protein n=1 Tax=Paramecium tetraurelia TaxID=5888 RepID=A0BD79_PARTE|nr:uncharacterized protein GSPATT00004590001 [Paramecium tetraurelia]CAK56496.1 unnamed protein product [Paramecium tetraurelia]|eukprot:XP_001423894.1 hypothetical protein (macronuclear) [Paramecium tetraurelia strain d4-2]
MIKSQINKAINLSQSILDDSPEFWIQRPQILIQFQLSDELSIVNRNRLIQKTIYFGGYYLKYGDDKFLDVRNLFLEIVYHPRTSQTGFRLSKNGEKLDAYGDIQNWVEVLRKYTIQKNLQQKYKIIKKIGEGSQFQVFKIRDKLTGQQNAVKIYDKLKLLNSPYLLDLLKKQIGMKRQFDHKNLIRLQEVYESANHLYVVEELVEGGTLESKISSTTFNQQQIILIIKQTLNGLQEMHKKGFIHGDVTLKAIGFKSEQDMDSLCLLHYSKVMSINAARNSTKKMYSQRPSLKNDKAHTSDLQQLGIILIRLLTGYQFNQFNLPSQMDDIKSILNFQQTSKELEILLQQLLLIDFELQLSDTNTPLEVLKNDIFKKQIEPQNFILKYQNLNDKRRHSEQSNSDDESMEIRSRVNTLPNIQDRNSESRSLSNRVKNMVSPLKISKFNKIDSGLKPPSQNAQKRPSNLYQLPRMNLMPKIKQKVW